ncbi:MAG: ABC transporter substrate-binding protein [Ottowia sp.]|nr:ABC transporter substrate-binding protein [Ottowia sp.]
MKTNGVLLRAVLGAALACLLGPGAALAQVRVGVVYSATGPTSLVGIPQKNTVPLLPKTVGDLDVEYIGIDDASDSTETVKVVRKLIDEQNVDAIIGPTGSPNAMGAIEFIAEAGVPMLAPVGTAAVVLPMDGKKKWVFKTTQNTGIIAQVLVDHMVQTGVKTLGFIGFADPYGDDWLQVTTDLLTDAGIQLVATERYSRQDTAVLGQALKLIGANPDAVLVAGTGGAAALPQITLRERGYQGKIYQTHGAALPAFIKLGGSHVEGTILGGSLMLVLPEIADANPAKQVAQDYIAAYEKLYGEMPATFGANVYDAGLLLQNAIPEAAGKARPGTPEFRAALRDALEQTHELVGTQGVYNMSAEDHSGFDERGRELITITDGEFRLLR